MPTRRFLEDVLMAESTIDANDLLDRVQRAESAFPDLRDLKSYLCGASLTMSEPDRSEFQSEVTKRIYEIADKVLAGGDTIYGTGGYGAI